MPGQIPLLSFNGSYLQVSPVLAKAFVYLLSKRLL